MGIRDPWRQGPQSPLFLPHEWVGGNDMWMHDVSSVGSVSGNIAEIPGICVTWQWHGMTPAWPPRRGQSDSALSCHGGRQNDKLWIHALSTPFAESLLYGMKKKKKKSVDVCVCFTRTPVFDYSLLMMFKYITAGDSFGFTSTIPPQILPAGQATRSTILCNKNNLEKWKVIPLWLFWLKTQAIYITVFL